MTPRDLVRLLPIFLGTAIVPLDSSVNVAFPAIVVAFGLEVAAIQWIPICYVLTYGSLMLAVGRIGDIFGHARVFRIGLAWSAVALALCALAPTYGALLGARVLQGIGAALAIGCGPALAANLFPEGMRVKALAAYATGFAAAQASGPLLGGVLVQAMDWQGVYWFRVPLALAALWLARGLPAAPVAKAREPFDAAGAVLLTTTVATALLAVNRAPAPVALLLAVIAVGSLAGFLWRSGRAARPIIDLGLFRRPGFAALNLANAMVNFAAFAVMLVGPFYLVRVAGLSALALGVMLAASHGGAVLGASLGGWAVPRFGARDVVLTGAALTAAGLLGVATWGATTPLPILMGTLAVQGIGTGLFTLAYTDAVTATMRREDRGVAGSLTTLTRTLGVVAAASLLTLLLGVREAAFVAGGAAPTAAFLAAYREVFLVAAALALLVLLVLRLRPRA
ncbi:MFS transporter [Roseomonas sp. JC162]|uniref:MFS transporter n=1 Tax=Neoroseomonas marina TaxID=1232220 RepID=A0A848EGH8_9PROT|nr:MFS transporter [Neoroseomonas marina]NMJ43541.1 MFS transporter [Neoroseomonas marina]